MEDGAYGRLIITPPPIGERSIVMTMSVCVSVCLSVCVCPSASISPEIHVRSLPNCLYMLPMAMARSSSGGVAICLCTSGFIDDVILAHKPRQLNVAAQPMEAQPTCSLGLGYKQRVGISVAGQWTYTHGPTFLAPRSLRTRPQWAC